MRFVDYIGLTPIPMADRSKLAKVLEQCRKIAAEFTARGGRIYVTAADMHAPCDRCGKPYNRHPVDEHGIYNVCGWHVKPRSTP